MITHVTGASTPAPAIEEPPSPAAGTDRRARAGWLAVGAMIAAVAATWAPMLTGPFGDNHYGRIHGRYALHLRNVQDNGLVGSHFSADWSPYATTPYAHHPPLQNLLGVVGGAMPGDGEWQLRIWPFLLGLLAIPAAAALLRGLRIGWGATLLAVGLMVATGYFWMYGLLRYDLAIILALSAAVVHLRRHPAPPWWLVTVTCLLALLATLASWPAIAFAAALGLWLLAGRRLDRVTVAVGVSMVAGVGLSLAFMVGVDGVGELLDQTGTRTGDGSYTAVEFLRRQGRYLLDLLPFWYLILLPISAVAGIADKRTRYHAAVSALYALGWVVVLNHGAYIHNYWGFLVLVPGLVGMGALLDRLAAALPSKVALAGTAVAGLAIIVGFVALVTSPAADEQLRRPVAAGNLVSEHRPPGGQQYAWYQAVPAPRWLVYYWDLPPRPATLEALRDEAASTDLVAWRLDRPPDWLPRQGLPEPVAQEGRYAVFRAGDLLEAVERQADSPNVADDHPGQGPAEQAPVEDSGD